MIVRELTGGVYFGEPKEIVTLNGQKRGRHPGLRHLRDRAHRPRRLRLAKRRNKVTSSEKDNVMKSGVLWKQVSPPSTRRVCRCQAGASCWPTTAACSSSRAETVRRHRLRQSVRRHAVRRRGDADRLARHAALRLARRARRQDRPAQGDVRARARLGARHAGKGLANPIATLASFGMALRYSFGLVEAADRLDGASPGCWVPGCGPGTSRRRAGTRPRPTEMGAAIVEGMAIQG